MIAADDRSELAGAVAVVTGGTGGIGSAICERLAGAGCRVVIVFRSNLSVAEALLEKLSGTGHCVVQADVTDTASLNRLAGEVRERCGRVQILVNCAGTTRFVPHADLDGLDDTTIDQIFRTNWRGPFATIGALKSLLLESPRPVIINISSIAAVSGI
jgi:3-oxoacyl-[acyl-carrier protein] reductase